MNSIYQMVMLALLTWLPRVPEATIQTATQAIVEATAHRPHAEQLALELAALATEESRLASYVLSGQCNDKNWRSSPEGLKRMRHGNCDSGDAFGAFQIHLWQPGVSKDDLLDIKKASIIAADLWSQSPQLWTSKDRALARAAQWKTRRAVPQK
jgi:hypothetical protein